MNYDLTRLGPTEFEHLAQALVLPMLGPSGLIFGAGRDGGREAATNHSLAHADGDEWSGYTVVQVKMRTRPEDTASNARWLRNEIRKELLAWTTEDNPRTPKPRNLLIITNVPLSAVPGQGLDAVLKVFDDFASKLPLAGRTVWHYEHVCRLLDANPSVRITFAGLVTPGDVLTELHRVLTGKTPDLAKVIRRHAAKELLADQWVRLRQSGSRTNEKLRLSQVAVDLPAQRLGGNEEPVCTVDHIINAGDSVLRPSLLGRRTPHVVVMGGPGQGKTTLGQLICQVYRVALLGDPTGLGPEVEEASAGLRSDLMEFCFPTPASRRWPIRVELGKYADHLAGAHETSLLRYLAERAAERTDEDISPSDLRSWLAAWPWLLVLDGFDEVTAPAIREVLVRRIAEFFVDAGEEDADLLVVATTRPRGYAGEFTPERYEHLSLLDLEPPEALDYARRLADVRQRGDPDMHAHVLARLVEAAEEDLTARLMRTPLQVTIMSVLLEGRSRVPRDRFGLFDAYYETIYNRETAKPGPLAVLLNQHGKTVNAMHDQVGLALQVDAETDGGSDPALPIESLHQLTRQHLATQEYSPGDAEHLSTKLVRAATERLVLLVPKNDHDVGFEVRSLQEFMAARALTTGGDDEVLRRLETLATSSHWRNTWLLAAGRLAALRDHTIDPVLGMLARLDSTDYLFMALNPGAALACDLLDDGFAAPSPRVRRLLLDRALKLLSGAPDATTRHNADVLHRVAVDAGEAAVAGLIRSAARQALGAQPPPKVTAAIMLRRWAATTGTENPLGATGRQLAPSLAVLGVGHADALRAHFLGYFRGGDASSMCRPHADLAGYLAPLKDSDESAERAYKRLRAELAKVTVDLIVPEDDGLGVPTVQERPLVSTAVLAAALEHASVADAVVRTLNELEPDDWAVNSALRVVLQQWLEHRRVGHHVLARSRSEHKTSRPGAPHVRPDEES